MHQNTDTSETQRADQFLSLQTSRFWQRSDSEEEDEDVSAEEETSDDDSSSEDEGTQQKKGPSRCGICKTRRRGIQLKYDVTYIEVL